MFSLPHLLAAASNLMVGDGLILLTVLLLFAFPIWMVVDCVRNESDTGNDKVLWILIILLAPFGSLIYFFVRKLGRRT